MCVFFFLCHSREDRETWWLLFTCRVRKPARKIIQSETSDDFLQHFFSAYRLALSSAWCSVCWWELVLLVLVQTERRRGCVFRWWNSRRQSVTSRFIVRIRSLPPHPLSDPCLPYIVVSSWYLWACWTGLVSVMLSDLFLSPALQCLSLSSLAWNSNGVFISCYIII